MIAEIISEHKKGKSRGITSICSANPWVIKAALQHDKDVLIEATCNQVNQFGGYSGLTPRKFIHFVQRIANDSAIHKGKIFFGGDHLGPNPWKNESVSIAMQKSEVMVWDYVRAGFTKLHIDCSMPLAGDGNNPISPEIIAYRTAQLIRVAENSIIDENLRPAYIIGSEVPIPGGAINNDENKIHVTKVENVKNTLDACQKALSQEGLDYVWDRIIAVVVQPGIEFGNDYIVRYDCNLTKELSDYIEKTNLIYEAHSTDYQDRFALRGLVEDHFALLKVGPSLTFAFREAIFSLARIEEELFPDGQSSNLINVIDEEMIRDPIYWKDYYSGDDIETNLSRKYSLSDRIRYYWNRPLVDRSMKKLFQNLSNKSIPVTLIRQYGLKQTEETIENTTILNPQAIILGRINEVLDDYYFACNNEG